MWRRRIRWVVALAVIVVCVVALVRALTPKPGILAHAKRYPLPAAIQDYTWQSDRFISVLMRRGLGPITSAVYDLDERRVREPVRIPGAPAKTTGIQTSAREQTGTNYELRSVTITQTWRDSGRTEASWKLAPPATNNQGWTALSPDGTRIAWLLLQYPSVSGFRWVQDVRTVLRLVPSPTVSLWVTDIHGGHRLEVGRIPVEVTSTREVLPYDLQWTPDSKHLSFIYRDALYVLPAP